MASEDVSETCFAHLSTEALWNILQFSFEPNKYPSHPNFLLHLCHQHHPLKKVAGTFVNSLGISCRYGPSQVQRQIFDIFAPRCTSLEIGNIPRQYTDAVSKIVFDCRNLKELVIGCPNGEDFHLWPLLAMQLNLEKLIVLSVKGLMNIIQSVETFGVGLKQLELFYMRPTDKAAITRMFKAIGNTLHSLKVTFIDDDTSPEADQFDVTTLFVLCPHIRDLCIYLQVARDSPLQKQRQSLICSYGAQLRSIDAIGGGMSKGNFDAMGNLDESFMSRMASACPNLEVELKCTEQNSLTVLNVLGPLVRELSISLRLLRMTVSAKCSLLKSASVQCCNLESLDIFGWCGPESKVQTLQFFSLAKPRLRKLRLWMSLKVPLPEDGVSDVIEAVAENTGALESLHISSPRLEPHLLRTLAGANKQLEKIHFATRIDGVDVSAQKARYAEYMTEIIEAFSICPALKWVRLKTCLKKLFKFDRKIVAVEDACVRIRHRNIVVLLDKIPYCSTNRLGCARVRPISHAPPDSSDEGEQGELP